MAADLGFGILVITFFVALYSIGAAISGKRMHSPALVDSARLAAWVTFPLLTLANLILIYLLVTGRFEFAYVYQVSDVSMPLYLKVTALWGGQSGSLLFWSWMLSGAAALAVNQAWKKTPEFTPWVTLTVMITLSFFLLIVAFVENPFARIWATLDGKVFQSVVRPENGFLIYPPDGVGLNPLLRHPGMIIHPPMLYAGFAGFIIPFSFAVASLAGGRNDNTWLRAARPWALGAWTLLTIGLVLGSRWAYDVLGWGGYWGWDPVEVAALIPWLTGTAFVHSLIVQSKRQLFKRWNVILIILTFCMVIFGIFLTRSGVLDSVHAFSQSSMGPMFFAFISFMFIGSVILLLLRWKSLASEGRMESLFSRESAFLFNNLLFTLLFFICLAGVLFPLISELFTGTKMTVGASWYKHTTGPVFGGLLLLMGVVPLTAWGSTSAAKLGRKIWLPALISLAVPVIAFWLSGLNWGGILALWLVTLAALVTLFDIGNAVDQRMHTQNEKPFKALGGLLTRNRHRYGGYLVHLGVVMIALGVIGVEFYQTQTQQTLAKGGSMALDGFTLSYKDLFQYSTADGRNVTQAVLEISRNGHLVATINPRSDYFDLYKQSVTVPGRMSNLAEDLYVVLADWQPTTTDAATFHVYHNPLVNWFWIGAVVMVLGALFALGVPDLRKAESA